MKKYETPEIKLVRLTAVDVITTSAVVITNEFPLEKYAGEE